MSRLNAYSRQAATTPAGTTDYPKLDRVPNGTYTFGINKAELKELPQGDVFTMKLKVLDGIAAGIEIDYDNWIVGERDNQLQFNERAVGRLKEELTVLGIRHEEWAEFDWFTELGKACSQLRGKCFRGEKSTNKQYHNLKFLESVAPPARMSAPPPPVAEEPIPF